MHIFPSESSRHGEIEISAWGNVKCVDDNVKILEENFRKFLLVLVREFE